MRTRYLVHVLEVDPRLPFMPFSIPLDNDVLAVTGVLLNTSAVASLGLGSAALGGGGMPGGGGIGLHHNGGIARYVADWPAGRGD
jgi:hypothetical protein